MIKGWRNNPYWVELYRRRDEQRADREIARLKAETDLQMSMERADAAMKRLNAPRLRSSKLGILTMASSLNTPKSLVLEKYPKAYCLMGRATGNWYIYRPDSHGHTVIGVGPTAKRAWAHAASGLS